MDEEELPPQPVFDSDETVNADTSKGVEFDEFSIVVDHLSEPEETLYVSSHEPDITIAQCDDDEAEKEIEVISERSEEPQKENKEDQPLVLVKPPTLPCIFAKPYTRVERFGVRDRNRKRKERDPWRVASKSEQHVSQGGIGHSLHYLKLLKNRFIDELALLMIDSILALLCLAMFISPIVYFSTLSPSTITTTGPIKIRNLQEENNFIIEHHQLDGNAG
ncbi:hypothetical protein Syun_004771 [Stephania yunnanensis]|uniref:Uncharacterized protein n=1 Tax=Stephania yunnanensis TaxID=152371 RepID=A0AAP0Q2V3_9MAGN